MYDQKISDEIKELLVKREQTIAIAESVTSGHLQAAMSLAMEASQFYQGGITAYNAGQKARHLNIDPVHAEKVNSVSERIAGELALNVSDLFLSNFGIGITGYATIVPQCEEEGLYAWCALSLDGEVVASKKITSAKSSPLDVQVDYTMQVFNMVVTYLREKN